MIKSQYIFGIATGLFIAFGFSVLYNKIPEANAAAPSIAAKQPNSIYYVLGDDSKRIKVIEWDDGNAHRCVLSSYASGEDVRMSLSCFRL